MKISVDTSHDSHEDIRKVISMLQHLVGDAEQAVAIAEQPAAQEQEATVAFSSMFGNDAVNQVQSEEHEVEEEQPVTEPAEPTEIEKQEAAVNQDFLNDLLAQNRSSSDESDDEPEEEEQPADDTKVKLY